jgi:ribonuclease D
MVDFVPLREAMSGCEWIIHAAAQDLPCLAELGLMPERVFDTELAGRLLGRERVGLAPLVESELGVHLEKGHGSADWSKRPLDPALIRYAALDVEYLIELRDVLANELRGTGKTHIAEQEFDTLLSFRPREPGPEPWRRTSGLHRARKPRQLAVVREMWTARDHIAHTTDSAPGRILPDSALVAAALSDATIPQELLTSTGFHGRGAAKYLPQWWAAVVTARDLATSELPAASPPSGGLPPPRAWEDRNPDAHVRLTVAREVLARLSENHAIPVENLMTPELVRTVCWDGPADPAAAFRSGGARPWQVETVAPALVAAWADSEAEGR